MLAPGSQLEGVSGERLQVLQQVGGGGLKAHFLLKGHKDSRTVEDVGCEKNKGKGCCGNYFHRVFKKRVLYRASF